MAVLASSPTVARSRAPEVASAPVVVRASHPVASLALVFNAQQGGANPASQTVILPVPAGTPMAATSDQAWLTASPSQLTAPTPLQVNVILAGLAPGDYVGRVTAAGANSVVTITVALTVTAAVDPTDPGDTATFTGSGWLPGTLVRVIPRLPGVDPPDKREWLAAGDYGLGTRTTVVLDRTVLASRTAGTDTKWTATLPAGPYWAVGVQGGEVRYVSFNA